MHFLKLTSIVVMAAAVMASCGGAISAYIGGTVSGLASGSKVGLTLAVNGVNVETLTVAQNNTDNTFTFNTTVDSDKSYNVTVTAQPTGQNCSPTNGSGTITSSGGDVTDVQISCQIGIGGTVPLSTTVAGLANGGVLVLQDIAAGKLEITGTGAQLTKIFPNPLTIGTLYSVVIQTQPNVGPQCSITAGTGSGTITGSAGTPSTPTAVGVVCR